MSLKFSRYFHRSRANNFSRIAYDSWRNTLARACPSFNYRLPLDDCPRSGTYYTRIFGTHTHTHTDTHARVNLAEIEFRNSRVQFPARCSRLLRGLESTVPRISGAHVVRPEADICAGFLCCMRVRCHANYVTCGLKYNVRVLV